MQDEVTISSSSSSSFSSSSIGTIVEHSQQERFTVPLPAARQTPNLEENQGLKRSQRLKRR
jgi:hypothetical protein